MFMKRNSQRGIAMLEYVVALGALIAVFILFGVVFQNTAGRATKRSIQSVKQDVPCVDASNPDRILYDEECL